MHTCDSDSSVLNNSNHVSVSRKPIMSSKFLPLSSHWVHWFRFSWTSISLLSYILTNITVVLGSLGLQLTASKILITNNILPIFSNICAYFLISTLCSQKSLEVYFYVLCYLFLNSNFLAIYSFVIQTPAH